MILNKAPQNRLLFLVILILLILDLSRSIHARIGYDTPNEHWEPSPDKYQSLQWPPNLNLPNNLELGERIYLEKCAVCHGPDGRGNGPAAPSMIPHPRDFTKGLFKYKSTKPGLPPTDEDLISTIKNGLNASGMPYWKDILTDKEIRAVVGFIKSLSPVFNQSKSSAIQIPASNKFDQTSVKRGEKLFQTQGCADCHGMEGKGGMKLKDLRGYDVIARDLTAPWTFRGGNSPKQIWLRLTTGLAPGPMPSFETALTPQERWDIVHYIQSIFRLPPWQKGGKFEGPGFQADLSKKGEYLVHAEMCGLCHTQVNSTGIYRGDDFYLAGGMRVEAYPYGVFVSKNLTSDVKTGLGKRSVEEIAKDIRTGRTPQKVLNIWGMPWMYLHGLSEQDAIAIASYLKTLPPVENAIPETLHFGFLETVIAKTYYFLTTTRGIKTLTYADGNYGRTQPGFNKIFPQDILVVSQWIFLALGIFLFLKTNQSKLRKLFILSIIGIIAVASWVIYHYPALDFIPANEIYKGAAKGIFQISSTESKTPQETAMAQRGQYLFTVASCAYCHGNDGSGGTKISWKTGFGSIWIRNITPDPETGIGNWSDREIARAIRSGITPDGRTLHWQGMIWDHASNWDEEDIRSLVSYLKAIPPVKKLIPQSKPPTESDCSIYVVFLEPDNTTDC
jgi:mono/diheme cytochrome c family protein